MFGAALPAAEHYVRLLAAPGVGGLLGPREVPRLWTRHVLNCAALPTWCRPVTLVDLGSGAGLPGIVLALLLPDVQVALLERMERRAIPHPVRGRAAAGQRRGTAGRAEEIAGCARTW